MLWDNSGYIEKTLEILEKTRNCISNSHERNKQVLASLNTTYVTVLETRKRILQSDDMIDFLRTGSYVRRSGPTLPPERIRSDHMEPDGKCPPILNETP